MTEEYLCDRCRSTPIERLVEAVELACMDEMRFLTNTQIAAELRELADRLIEEEGEGR